MTDACVACGAIIGHRYECPVFQASLERDRERHAKQEAYEEIDRLRAELAQRVGQP